jgi:pilus assembly protein CpaB
MSLRTIATIAIALVLGLVAVFLARGFLAGPKAAAHGAAAAQAMTTVVVAASGIERGQALDAKVLKIVNYPAASVPQGAFQTVAQITSGPSARLALRSIEANEPILAARISGPGAKPNLAAELTPGMRAVSLRSNDVLGVGGFVLPGDRVDIFLTRSIASAAGDKSSTVTQALAQNVRVLGVDQSSNEDSTKPQVAKAVTVEVTPDQAQAILLGDSVGTVSMSLRQISDGAALARRVTTVADLGNFGGGKAARPAAAGAKPSGKGKAHLTGPGSVRVTRGVETTDYSVAGH